ncbi:unnamed protein product [Rotaria sordida]|uniref:RNA-directed RNA polymerase n=1 Tax=Rotaria sordida TaxID=392033 RepID=A0A814V613_9BILA|nr:unnamed protein product [Rotaria sordida]
MSTVESLSEVDTNDDSLEDETYDNYDPDDSNDFNNDENHDSNEFDFDENDDSNDFDFDENDDSNDFNNDENHDSNEFDFDENDDSNGFNFDENDDSNGFDYDENDDSHSWVNTETKAFHLVRHRTSNGSTNSNSSTPFLSDSLKIYLNAPPLIREIHNTGTYCLVIDPIADESERMPLSTPQLYVGNIPYSAKWYDLRNWFAERGCNVSRVDMKKNQKGAHYAFVRFDCVATAAEVLYHSEHKIASFVFNDRPLYLRRCISFTQKHTNTSLDISKADNSKSNVTLKITDIHYGTLIAGTSLKNIQTVENTASNTDRFGIIAHTLEINKCKDFHLEVNKDKKSIAITSALELKWGPDSINSTILKFEWSFHDLKRRKITLVLINENEVFLLMEIKQPPILLETKDTGSSISESHEEKRLPGFGLIGHANVWLFKLASNDGDNNIRKLIQLLSDNNLLSGNLSESDIICSIQNIESAKKNLEPITLISNDKWIRENQAKVDSFFNHRWPLYPFETKFETMKLISKHIVTVHDLIVDERAEHILQLCSINTLVALTDKIFEFALLWCAKTCDKEDDDWNNQNESEENQLPDMDDLPITDDDFFISKNIRFAATGGFINAEIASKMTTMESLGLEKYPGGRLSRLFNLAFEKLLKNYELCRTASGIVLTRLELRTAKNDSFLTRKIYITPSTILYEGPYYEEKCAVTREYVQYQDRFLRVTFRDEDYRVLHNYNDNMAKMYERIKKILKNGINVCDRNYQFLAFSSSQLREHSCWMFASPDDRTTVDIIREWMGDFRNVHPIAKLAARLGQSFSTSIKGIQLESHQIKEISDERRSTTEINGIHEYCFTDGIGIISLTLAKRLARTMKLPETVCPCAFQIRCGGYKGMVCLDVAGKINNPNIDVYFRESMNKFAAKTLSIDVIRTSLHPTVAYLNRQIILLLSSLGIGDQIFLSLQSDMLKMLKALEGNFLEACETLKKLSNFDENGYHGFLIAYLKHLREQRDPFVRQLIRVIRTSLVKELRTKAKIFVPNSWSLLGVVDESRTLNYGEVFIQIDSSNEQRDESTGKIFRGPVVVTRNPCFHPGDIRKLTAVDVPALHSLKNVIVFPMNGPRAHPAEMSGGDLDGDTFWISRHPDLIFKENEDPFDYQDQDHEANKMQTTNDVQHTIEDVCNFFGEYIAADNLGLIANSHLALSDQLEDGVRNKNCLQLAKMHSVAVDFAKKGINAPHLTKELRPSQYPHFMEKNDKPTYHSKSILGQLHDKIPFYDSEIHIDEEEEIRATSSFPYKSFFIAGDKNYIKDARIIKGEYNRDILRIMRQYGIQNEAEIVSGCLLKFTSKQYVKETKIFDLRNEITHAYKVIRDKYLTLFWKEFYQVTDESDEEKVSWSEISKKLSWKNQVDIYEYYNQMTLSDAVKQKASAWFHTTYESWIKRIETYRKIKNKKQNKSMDNQRTKQFTRFNELFSFAWLVYPVLLEIYTEDEKVSTTKKKNKRKNAPMEPTIQTKRPRVNQHD